MSNVTNLNRFRKQKARDRKRDAGDENAVKFGQTKAEREARKKRAEKALRDLEAHRRDKE